MENSLYLDNETLYLDFDTLICLMESTHIPDKECSVKCSSIFSCSQRKEGGLDHVTLVLNHSPRRHPVLLTSVSDLPVGISIVVYPTALSAFLGHPQPPFCSPGAPFQLSAQGICGWEHHPC